MHNGILTIIDIVLYGSVASIIAIGIIFLLYIINHIYQESLSELGPRCLCIFDDEDLVLYLKLSLDVDPKIYMNHKRLSGQQFYTI